MVRWAGIGLIVATLGCAQEVGDIDRTQANRVQKSVFQGDWYLARTVIDVPYTSEVAVLGDSAELERIRWEILEDVLLAYRTYDRVDGTDKATTVAGDAYQGAPIAAFKIVKHFDVKREYNASTGEQTNVIVENDSDRPWYEREYMRVDWSENVLPSLSFLVDYEAPNYFVEASLTYHSEQPGNPNHFRMGVRGAGDTWVDYRDDASIAALTSADYLEATVQVVVQPQRILVEDFFGDVYRDPACWYYLNADCEHQNVLVRMSFMKVPTESSYEVLHFPDNEVARDSDGKPIRVSWQDGKVVPDPDAAVLRYEMFDKFGYFRVERHGYDPVYGELESNRVYYATRWNLYDPSGAPRPIVYYLSPGFPEWLKASAQAVADEWNQAFVEAVAATGKTPPARMFELRENSGQRIGDMRYSFLYYVAEPTVQGLLGYGPSLADPLTGEIVSASAFVYGAPIHEFAGYGRQIVDVLSGRITPEEIGLGADVQLALAQQGAGRLGTKAGALTSERPRLTAQELEDFVRDHVDTPRGQAILDLGREHFRRPSSWFQARLDRVRGTPMEDLLLNDEVKLLKGKRIVGPGDDIPPEIRPQLTPAAWMGTTRRQAQQKRLKRLARKNKLMATFADDAVTGLAQQLVGEGKSPEEVLSYLHERLFASTAEHELGHTFGLRHNFAGSYDALNFPRRYWDLRGAAPQFPPAAPTAEQIAGRMDEYRYSSIMEYAARFNADIQGLGLYDRAAILFGYSQMVEVFESAPPDPLTTAFSDAFDLRFALQEMRHYTSLPSAVGGLDAMYARKFVPYADYKQQLTGARTWTWWEVPYRFCSDEYEGATSWCAMYDAGMDPYEIVQDAAYRYRNYYFFRAFKRDRAGWDGWDYDSTAYFRYFRHMLTQYQHWAFTRWDDQDLWNELRLDPTAYGIEDVPWDLARDGGGPRTAATRSALSFLVEVLAIPRPGAYAYDADNDLYWNFDDAMWDQCPANGLEKDGFPADDCTDLSVPLGVGRYSFTRYDADSGYYFYERPKWVGAFIDKALALEVLSDPTVTFLGVNTDEDVQGYALGFFLYFPEILARVAGGIINDSVREFAGTTREGIYSPPNPFGTPPPDSTTVDPDTWSTVQYWAMWLAMSGFSAGFDNTFNDLIQVLVPGEDHTIADPNAPNVATFTDPDTQRTYMGVKGDDRFYSLAYEMVKKAAALHQKAEGAGNTPTGEYYRQLYAYQRELMDLARGMYEVYGKLLF